MPVFTKPGFTQTVTRPFLAVLVIERLEVVREAGLRWRRRCRSACGRDRPRRTRTRRACRRRARAGFLRASSQKSTVFAKSSGEQPPRARSRLERVLRCEGACGDDHGVEADRGAAAAPLRARARTTRGARDRRATPVTSRAGNPRASQIGGAALQLVFVAAEQERRGRPAARSAGRGSGPCRAHQGSLRSSRLREWRRALDGGIAEEAHRLGARSDAAGSHLRRTSRGTSEPLLSIARKCSGGA
jgi:hypothetical protein